MSLANCLIYSADRFISYSNDQYTAFVCIYITLISPFNFPKYVCAQIHNKICAQALRLDLLDQEALTYHTQPSFSAGFLGPKTTLLSPFLRAFMKQMVAAMLHLFPPPSQFGIDVLHVMCTTILEHDLV